MEGVPSMDTVKEAIYTLYHNPDCNEKNKANRWLMDLQNSVHAWEIADQLLLQKNCDVDMCYFGAQMIRNKIMYSFHELPQDAIVSLHSSLMQRLNEITEETKNLIVTQLCVAVVDLTLQMSSWKNPIYTFLNKYEEIPHMVLLEILKVFPEEMDTELIRLGSNRRTEIFNELCGCSNLLNDYLKVVVERDQSPAALLKALKCYASWMSIGVLECHLLPNAFDILRVPPDDTFENESNMNSKLHDAASDVVCNFLKGLRSSHLNHILDRNLFNEIAAFEKAYHISVAKECTEKSMNYCRIFCELADAFIPVMTEETKQGNPHFSIKTLDLILICVGHHEYEVGEITFPFWFVLSEVIYQRNDDNLTAEFKPYINRLLTALCRQVQIEPDHEGLLEDNDEFKSFRARVSELVKDVIFIVGSTHTFRQMFHSMQSSPNLTWDQIEANLFIMQAVAKNILPDESEVVPQAVTTIFQLPESTHIAVRYTAVLILGELCEWFDRNPQYLVTALEYLAMSLQQNEVADAAATAMSSICFIATVRLKEYFKPLLEILRNLHSFNLTNDSAIAIIKGVSMVMSRLSNEEITMVMKESCWLQVNPMRQLVEHSGTNQITSRGTNFDPAYWLDRLAAVFRYTNPETNGVMHPCTPAFSEIQPVLFQVMDHYQNDLRTMERCCRCLRFAIRSVGKSGNFILEPLIRKLVVLYGAKKHSCFMYLGSVLVDEYGEDMSNWEIILSMVDAFIEPTLALLQNPSGLKDHPDTIDDLFRLCSRVLQRLPAAFLRSSSILPVLECGLVAVSLDHREANSSVMKFFHEIFDSRANQSASALSKKEAVQQIFEKIGESLIMNLIHASIFILRSSLIYDVSEVIFDLIQFNSKVVLSWMESSIQKLPKHDSSGGLMASNEQIQIFLNKCEKAIDPKEVSRALKHFTHYYR